MYFNHYVYTLHFNVFIFYDAVFRLVIIYLRA